jgi:hypothetical protein
VVDLRHRTAFAAGHLGGTYGFELSESFVTYLGWLYAWGAPLTLIADDENQIATARRELVRIGMDVLQGAATGDIRAAAGGSVLRSYRVVDFAALAGVIGNRGWRCWTCAKPTNSTTATSAERSTYLARARRPDRRTTRLPSVGALRQRLSCLGRGIDPGPP